MEYQRTHFEYPWTRILAAVVAARLPGEHCLATAQRLLVNEALAESLGRQAPAARLLGISNARLNGIARRLQLRPRDRKSAESRR